MPLRGADGNVHARAAAAQTHASRLRVTFEKFLVGNPADDDGFVFHKIIPLTTIHALVEVVALRQLLPAKQALWGANSFRRTIDSVA
jgi:hypothetical protein